MKQGDHAKTIWLNCTVQEGIQAKQASFEKQKCSPNEAHRQEHKLWQVKCQMEIRMVSREFEEHIDKDMKLITKILLVYEKQDP